MLNRSGAAAVLACLALVLASCGSSNSESTARLDVPVECGGKQELKASGATAQENQMELFVADFEKACPGQTVSYTPNGSGPGVDDFIAGRTDFVGTDTALDAEDPDLPAAVKRCGSDVWNLPVVFGPIAITYNLATVESLALDAETLAKIFTGQITRWDDPALRALNTSLPPVPIQVVYRNGESGTTDHFQQYLDAAAGPAWGRGDGQSFLGGVGKGADGNEGTASIVKNTQGAITYNEWSFAQEQNLPVASIVTRASRNPVTLSADSVGKTIDDAQVNIAGNNLVLDTSAFYKPTEEGAYPIVLVTYETVCAKYADPEVGKAVRAFLQSTIGRGQTDLPGAGFIALPPEFQEKVAKAVNAIT